MGHRRVGVGSPDLKVQGLYCSGTHEHSEYSEYSEYSRAGVCWTRLLTEAAENLSEFQGTVGCKVPIQQSFIMTETCFYTILSPHCCCEALTVPTVELIKF